MHYFGIPRHIQSMIAYKILTEYFWKFQWKIALSEHLLHALFDSIQFNSKPLLHFNLIPVWFSVHRRCNSIHQQSLFFNSKFAKVNFEFKVSVLCKWESWYRLGSRGCTISVNFDTGSPTIWPFSERSAIFIVQRRCTKPAQINRRTETKTVAGSKINNQCAGNIHQTL